MGGCYAHHNSAHLHVYLPLHCRHERDHIWWRQTREHRIVQWYVVLWYRVQDLDAVNTCRRESFRSWERNSKQNRVERVSLGWHRWRWSLSNGIWCVCVEATTESVGWCVYQELLVLRVLIISPHPHFTVLARMSKLISVKLALFGLWRLHNELHQEEHIRMVPSPFHIQPASEQASLTFCLVWYLLAIQETHAHVSTNFTMMFWKDTSRLSPGLHIMTVMFSSLSAKYLASEVPCPFVYKDAETHLAVSFLPSLLYWYSFIAERESIIVVHTTFWFWCTHG